MIRGRIKVRYNGNRFSDYVIKPFKQGKIYEVISIEKGWYRILCELDEDYLFPPLLFEIVEDINEEL